MGYLFAILSLVFILIVVIAVWPNPDAPARKRRKLDYQKGTSYEQPLDEGATQSEAEKRPEVPK